MVTILTKDTFYDDVRAALDSSLTPEDLTDGVIGSLSYEIAALREITRRDPLWDTRTGPDEAQLQLAAVLLTASLLAPQLAIISREKDDTYEWQRQAVDLPALAATLRQKAEAALSVVLDAGHLTPYRPTFFAVARGRRGA